MPSSERTPNPPDRDCGDRLAMIPSDLITCSGYPLNAPIVPLSILAIKII